MYTETNSENTRKQGSVPVLQYISSVVVVCMLGMQQYNMVQYVPPFLVLYKEKKILFLNPQMFFPKYFTNWHTQKLQYFTILPPCVL